LGITAFCTCRLDWWALWRFFQFFKYEAFSISKIVIFFFFLLLIFFSYIRTKRQRFLECMLVATASAFIGFITLLLIDDCQSIGINPQLTGVMKVFISLY